MDAALPHLPKLSKLPTTLPRDGSINLVLEGSVPTFRAAPAVVGRVTQLLERDRGGELSQAETEELERYEELDDYLSHPLVDPHGDPIPKADGSLAEIRGEPLSKLAPGRRFKLARVVEQENVRA